MTPVRITCTWVTVHCSGVSWGWGKRFPLCFGAALCEELGLSFTGCSLDVLEEQMRSSLGCEQRQECFIALY